MGLVDDYLSAYKVGKKEQMAARMAFFISGFAVATWAPMIPAVKDKLQIGADILGMLLLSIGISAFIFYAAGRHVKPQLRLQKSSAYRYRRYGSGFDNFIAAWQYLGLFGISCGFWRGNGLYRC